MEPLLSARSVRKTYRTGTHDVEALRGVDLDIFSGEMVTIMGPSGNGKTTLLNCLSGLDEIDEGTVIVDGEDIFALSDARRTAHRARRMGFVFQSFHLIPVLTAAENVELALQISEPKAADARRRAAAMLDRVGLSGRHDHRPNELSGGEQQRVAVARALVAEPAIVWADEPTGNLDSATADAVLDLLHEVNSEGQTLVIVTHDRAIGNSGNRLILVQDGLITSDGAPALSSSGDTATLNGETSHRITARIGS